MQADGFEEQLGRLMTEFGQGRTMVLSTAENGKVSSRMMSVVRLGRLFYFQTDTQLRKYAQLRQNPRAALCTDNIQLEGLCEETGRPLENEAFCEAFKACFPGSFKAYSALENERLFAFRPLFIERWVYKEQIPYLETYDLPARQYAAERYSGR